MKRFAPPKITLIQLANEIITVTSGLCYDKYCDDYTCPKCDENGNHCAVQTDCTARQCKGYLCLEY